MSENKTVRTEAPPPGRDPGGGGPGGHGPGGRFVATGEKRPFSEGFGRLLKYNRPFMVMTIVALLCALGGAIFTIVGPEQLKKMTNLVTAGLQGSIDMTAVTRVGLMLIALYGVSALLSYIQAWVMATVTHRLSKSLRTDIGAKINRLPLKYFDSTNIGDILSRVTNDVDTIGQTLNQSLASMVSATTLLLGSVFMMFRNNWIMALTAMGASVFGFIFMVLIIGRSQKYFVGQQKYLGRINGHVEEIYSGHNVVVAYNAKKQEREKFTKINDKLYESVWKSQFMSGVMMPLMGFIGNLGYVAVCVVGAALAMDGAIDMGDIVAFIVYVRLFSQPLSQLAQVATSMQSAGAASARVFEFLGQEECPDESGKTEKLETARGDVRFSRVKFAYDPGKPVIKNFSADVKAGQKIAIVGPTGAGKTTMVNLLMRFYDADDGVISIDGVPISELTRENVHDLFCMVLQDTWIFEGTIRENIVYSKEGVTEEEVIRACKTVGLHHFVKTMPDGYDTVLTDNASLSGGQRQLVTIARAMIDNAPMLILDEATSSVDTRTEILIQNAMDKLMAGRTSFVIAHRLSTIRNADLILVMNDGDIIESGTHDALMKKSGFYADLYNSQFEN